MEGAYGATCGACPPIAAEGPAADVAAAPDMEEDDAAAAAERLPFAAGAGVAEAAVGRERRFAVGLREFDGRAGAVAAAVAVYAVGVEMACWWEVVERRDSVGEAARSVLIEANSTVV